MKIEKSEVCRRHNITYIPLFRFLKELGYNTNGLEKLDEVQYMQVVEYFSKNQDCKIDKTEIEKISPLYMPKVGDTIFIPKDYILKRKLYANSDRESSFIYALVTNKQGQKKSISFFPNSLCKSINPIVEDAKQARVRTKGTATDLYREADSVQEGIELLKGKKIYVSRDDIYTVEDYNTKKYRKSHIYRYDLVEEVHDFVMASKKIEKKILNSNSVECVLIPLVSKYYLQTPESYSINEDQKKIALEYARCQIIPLLTLSAQLNDFGISKEKCDVNSFTIKKYGNDIDTITIIQKEKYSFVSLDYNKKNWAQTESQYFCILPLPGLVEDVRNHYDQDGFILDSEIIVLNEQGQFGVFDYNGRHLLPFQNGMISFVESNVHYWFDCKYLYSVKEGKLPPSIYYKDTQLFINVIRVIPYYEEENFFIVVCHYDGWQVYDMSPWLNKMSKMPIPLLQNKLPIDGKEPFPRILSEYKLGIFLRKDNNDRFGFIEIPSGKLIIPCVYNYIVSGFVDGMAKVAVDDRGNYIIINDKNTIISWGNSCEEERKENACIYSSNVGDWSFADAELEDFRDNYDPN